MSVRLNTVAHYNAQVPKLLLGKDIITQEYDPLDDSGKLRQIGLHFCPSKLSLLLITIRYYLKSNLPRGFCKAIILFQLKFNNNFNILSKYLWNTFSVVRVFLLFYYPPTHFKAALMFNLNYRESQSNHKHRRLTTHGQLLWWGSPCIHQVIICLIIYWI